MAEVYRQLQRSYGITFRTYERKLPDDIESKLADSDYEVHCAEKLDGFCVFCKSAFYSSNSKLEEGARRYGMMLVSKHGKEFAAYETSRKALGVDVLYDYLYGMTVAGELVFEEIDEESKEPRHTMTREEKFNLLKKIASGHGSEEYAEAWTEDGMAFIDPVDDSSAVKWGRLKLVLFDLIEISYSESAAARLGNMSYAERLDHLRQVLASRQNDLLGKRKQYERDSEEEETARNMAVEVIALTRVHSVQDIHSMERDAYERNAEGIIVNIDDKRNGVSRVKLKKVLDVDAIVTDAFVRSDADPEPGWHSKYDVFNSFRYVIVNMTRSKRLLRDAQGICKGDIMRIPWRGPPRPEKNKIITLRVTLWRNRSEDENNLQPRDIRHVWVKPLGDPVQPILMPAAGGWRSDVLQKFWVRFAL